eukprot:1150700-Pelagomonas_calceolata.AAC.2
MGAYFHDAIGFPRKGCDWRGGSMRYKAGKTHPTSVKEKRIPRAEAPCTLFTKRSKGKIQWGSGGLLAVARA